MDKPLFRPGRNTAVKVPPHQFDATAAFYRDGIDPKAVPLPFLE